MKCKHTCVDMLDSRTTFYESWGICKRCGVWHDFSSNSIFFFFSVAPDLSGGHDAFAVTKLPPCVSSNQRDLHWVGLTSYFHAINHCWHHVFMSLGTLSNSNCFSLNQCYSECSKFCVFSFSPWLTVNPFGHVTHFWYPFICRGIFQIYAERYSCTLHLVVLFLSRSFSQESLWPGSKSCVPTSRKSKRRSSAIWSFRKDFCHNLKVTLQH